MRTPTSTYRLQMTSEQGFAAVRDAVPYLHRLGVGDVYLSPILQAAPGSTHGYDVADPSRLDSRLGTMEEFLQMSAALREREMGLVLDIVPNHMAAHVANPWWHDVLRHGQDSMFASHFDIAWSANGGKLLLPVLGAPLDEVLAAGELKLEGDQLVYFDDRWPIAPGSGEAGDLAAVVAAQRYELADWRAQATRLNYRRFFDITGLAALQVERPEVFEGVHRFTLDLIADGHVTGLRIDHVDGLLDPRSYLEMLQESARAARGGNEPFYIVVEKILAREEQLPPPWPVAGTTGYEFIDVCEGAFIDPVGAELIKEHYAATTQSEEPFDDVVARAKLRTIRDLFWGELGRLAATIVDRDEDVDPEDDVALRRVRDALAVVTAELPVYRTYVDARGRASEDTRLIERALSDASAHDGVDPVALARVAHALRHDVQFTMRWQQFSGPVTAKSVEDTAFYRYWALPSRNEVGVHPSDPASAAGTFHWHAGRQSTERPASLNAASTHDTKRSEDVRARLMALQGEPEWWSQHRTEWIERFDAPDPSDGWMVATTLVGAGPISAERIAAYVRKAVREEKEHSSWTEPNAEYEQAIIDFAERLRTSGEVEPVIERVRSRAQRISLGIAAMRMFAPGVPDVYQGCELEFLALVDPDNRRDVDFAALDAMLDTSDAPPKLRLISGALRARRADPALFGAGSEYLPLRSGSPSVLAFARRSGDAWAIVAARTSGIGELADVRLDLPEEMPGSFTHVATGTRLDVRATSIGALLEHFPVLIATA